MTLIILKKNVWGKWTILEPKMMHFLILHNERGELVDESNNNGLYQKKIVQDKWANGPYMEQWPSG